ncbi:unnamed protein product [Caenorhabditis auriculariae]|uniref:DRBM domain-containing protein n=1 Tax=Caenorhabditis auriculariae TaxID=2777116 RepID=A0A8S1HCE7_9PELO|nr:unnamed protein product [Caenorhabditis auriculariae]
MEDQMESGTALYTKKTILAPMVRAGRTPLRILSLDYGADLCYTEEIVDHKLLSCERILNDAVGTIDYKNGDDIVLRIAPEERGRCVLQIGTNNGESAARVAKFVQTDVAAIDVNMGCPKPFSVHAGMGAALLRQTDKIKDILTSLVQAAEIPVSCKIRVLDDPSDTLNLVREIEKCGVAALGVHGRRREERNPDKCRIEEIREVARTVTSIPIITNGVSGEIDCYEDIEKWRVQTGASSVMLARKALATPSIFRREGVLEKDKDIEAFLDKACKYDESYTMTKYVVQRILGADQEYDPRGRKTVCAGSVLEICRAWGKEQVYEEWHRDRQRRCCKRKARVTEDGTTLIEVTFPMKKLKTARQAVPTPKQVLNDYCGEKRLPKPVYSLTKREDKRYVATIEVEERRFRSEIGQVNVRMAEQVAALAALIGLGIRERLKGEWEEE